MRVVLGVHHLPSAHQALQAVLELGFNDLEVRPTHVMEHVGSTLGKYLLTVTESDYYAQYMQNEQLKAQELLSSFEKELQARGIQSHARLREGHVVNELMAEAQESQAELVAVTLKAQETLGHFFFGSVGRKMIFQCPTSFFVYKPWDAPETLKRAVFATDHSVFAQKALERLIRMRPQGIEHIAVLTAYPQNLTSALAPFVSQLGLDVSRWVEDKLYEENQAVVKRLQQEGFHAVAEVRGEPIHEAIESSLKHQEAGLLILGAQGHGMLEGLSLGSVAAHQVLHTRHSVLVVRPA
ncbi:MAG TPA: universal stress protein [Oligoflexus sp.]|uniref:universal stress protein n=1 Tax=Oligoflexus sp. TaxID=1971216 RepID=UPI002D70552F|nr:universal stress protein [Oligoflexus sp.]HYX33107.1 universal stress protein [Oligoflexus sp.]